MASWILGAFGCSGDDIDVIGGRPPMPQPTNLITIDAPSDITAVDVDGEDVLVGTQLDLERVRETVLEPVELYSEIGDNDTGSIVAIAGRIDDVVVATNKGFYETDGKLLVRSGLSDALAGVAIRSVDAVDVGYTDRIWIGADDGLYKYEHNALSRWRFGDDPPVTAVCEIDGVVLVATPDALFEINVAEEDDDELDFGFGAVHGIVRGEAGTAYLATDGGLVERRADGSYAQYTLSDTETPSAVHSVSYDGMDGAVASADFGVVKLTPSGALEGVAALSGAARALSVGPFGNVWLGRGSELTRVHGGTVISYAEVQPIFETMCMGCHREGSQKPISFDDYETAVEWADAMVIKLSHPSEPMPPQNATQLTLEQRSTLLRWYYGDTQP